MGPLTFPSFFLLLLSSRSRQVLRDGSVCVNEPFDQGLLLPLQTAVNCRREEKKKNLPDFSFSFFLFVWTPRVNTHKNKPWHKSLCFLGVAGVYDCVGRARISRRPRSQPRKLGRPAFYAPRRSRVSEKRKVALRSTASFFAFR